MTVQAINSANSAYPQKFIEAQTKQLMRENIQGVQKEAVDSVSSIITNKYMNVFQNMIKAQNKKTTENDIKIILKSIEEAYRQSKLTDDADAIGKYIQTLG